MKNGEVIISGRKYMAVFSEDDQKGAYVITGPHEGLVDELGLPEPLATTLHNILYDRGLFTFKEISRPNVALGAWQDALQQEAYRLVEKYAEFEKKIFVE